jgi:Lar family restriction alleviation protein
VLKGALPCPFCGSDHIKYFGTNGDSIYCRNCNAEGPGTITGTFEDALKAWNTRTNGVINNVINQTALDITLKEC